MVSNTGDEYLTPIKNISIYNFRNMIRRIIKKDK